jgi:hypothetical protein
MKTNILLMLCMCIASNSFSQETINLKFYEADPIWEHTMVDTTFIPTPNQVALNKYRSLIPEIIDIDGNNVYILGTCDSYEIFKEGGFVMDKLDIHTGK